MIVVYGIGILDQAACLSIKIFTSIFKGTKNKLILV